LSHFEDIAFQAACHHLAVKLAWLLSSTCRLLVVVGTVTTSARLPKKMTTIFYKQKRRENML